MTAPAHSNVVPGPWRKARIAVDRQQAIREEIAILEGRQARRKDALLELAELIIRRQAEIDKLKGQLQ